MTNRPTIPSDVNTILQKEVGDACKNAATLEDVHEAFTERTGYMLKMFWLGRADKINSELRPCLDWMTRSFVPPDVLRASAYSDFRNGEVQFKRRDHTTLMFGVINQTFEICQSLDGINLPASGHKQPKSLLSRLMGRRSCLSA